MHAIFLTVTFHRAHMEISCHIFNFIYTTLFTIQPSAISYPSAGCHAGCLRKNWKFLCRNHHLRELFNILLLWNGKWLWRSKYTRKKLISTTLLQLLSVLDFLSTHSLGPQNIFRYYLNFWHVYRHSYLGLYVDKIRGKIDHLVCHRHQMTQLARVTGDWLRKHHIVMHIFGTTQLVF